VNYSNQVEGETPPLKGDKMFKYVSTPYYKALPNDKFIGCNCTAKATKFVLPTLPNGGDSITIKKTDSSANVITVIGEHGQMIDNATRQVETATVIGAITGTGNATVVVTAAGMAGSPLTLSVPVLNGDAIATTGLKIRNVINGTKAITDMFYVSGSAANIVLTQIDPIGNDATLNISIDNGTCTGLTTAASSTNTTAGVAVTIPTQNEYATFVNNGTSWILSDRGGVNVTETFTNKTMDSESNTFKNVVLAYAGSITRAEMVAGKVLVAAVTGRTIKVLSVKLGVVGAFNGGAGTSFILQDTHTSPVVILTALKAALTDTAKISTEGLAIANVTEGAGMTAALTASKGIAVKADAAWDAGTNINIVIEYMYA
jgi:hypothetical protein